MLHVSTYAPIVQSALDNVVVHSSLKNDSSLARTLDVTKQALSKWRVSGLIPAHRAMQMELLTNGKVSWKELCPDIVEDFNRKESVYAINR